jgi:hypothetical protein
MAIEIVDFPINSMVDLSIVFCKRLPEGTPKKHTGHMLGYYDI